MVEQQARQVPFVTPPDSMVLFTSMCEYLKEVGIVAGAAADKLPGQDPVAREVVIRQFARAALKHLLESLGNGPGG